jgi:CheY-like chemotaxis protein
VRILTYATFEQIVKDGIELKTLDGVKALMHRDELKVIKNLDFKDDTNIEAFFSNEPELLVVCNFPSNPDLPLDAILKPFEIEANLKKIASIKRNDPIEVKVRDTNNREYIFAESEYGAEVRISKSEIRQYIKELRIKPYEYQNDQDSNIEEDEIQKFFIKLEKAEPKNDDFWLKYYPLLEIFPGDAVVGSVLNISFDNNGKPIVDINLRYFLESVREDPCDTLLLLGLSPQDLASADKLENSKSSNVHHKYNNGSFSILLVDDEEDSREPLECLLADDEHEVVGVATKMAAIEKINNRKSGLKKQFDVAIIDIHLNPHDTTNKYHGLQLANEIQSTVPECAIILISAEDETNGKKQNLSDKLLVYSFLPKPFLYENLVKILNRIPNSSPVPAKDLFPVIEDPNINITHKLSIQRGELLGNIRDNMHHLKNQIDADSVYLFKFHKISFDVNICSYIGLKFPDFYKYRKGLRYSPVSDICEEREEWCHFNITESHLSDKHKNLLRLCRPYNNYDCCAACPVPSPPGDECLYGLFAFSYPKKNKDDFEPAQFKLSNNFERFLTDNNSNILRSEIILLILRECAAYIAQHLVGKWFKEIQIRQHPCLTAGMQKSSKGHDISNKLFGANNQLEVLIKHLKPDSIVNKEEYDRLTKLRCQIRSVVEFAKSSSRRVRAHIEQETTFSVKDSVINAICDINIEFQETKTEITWKGSSDIFLSCRRGVLDRVLFNILLNAVQQIDLSMRNSGYIQIHYFIKKYNNRNDLIIRIYDTGTGIHAYQRSRIFLPGETSRKDGAGLGLSICREEMVNIDGKIHVMHSIIYSGTCFEIVIDSKRVSFTKDKI